MNETPIATTDGLSGRRDRMWGWIGAVLGSAVGLGSAAIAIFVEGANAYQSSPYPPFFTKRQLLAYDVFLGALGAALAGTILMVLGSALLFTRLITVVRG